MTGIGTDRSYPSYAELVVRTDAPSGSAWGVFGAEDEIGTINFLAPAIVARAAGVRRGAVFNLDAAVNSIRPWPGGGRKLAEHHITKRPGPECDDWLDAFYPQQTSPIDGLRHRGHPEPGFYNGIDADLIQPNTPSLGTTLGRARDRRSRPAAGCEPRWATVGTTRSRSMATQGSPPRCWWGRSPRRDHRSRRAT